MSLRGILQEFHSYSLGYQTESVHYWRHTKRIYNPQDSTIQWTRIRHLRQFGVPKYLEVVECLGCSCCSLQPADAPAEPAQPVKCEEADRKAKALLVGFFVAEYVGCASWKEISKSDEEEPRRCFREEVADEEAECKTSVERRRIGSG